MPEEAETVRLIFRRYLEVGSIRHLVQDLDRKRHSHQAAPAIRWQHQAAASGSASARSPTLLRNRLYIGEVVYRGAVHRGEHEPIVDRALFDAVQAKLAPARSARRLRLKASPAILTGRIFDDRGNRMTPTHTNKHGARYRYYVSHALMQKRREDAGSVLACRRPRWRPSF